MVIDYRGMSVWVFASQPRTLWGVMNDKGTGPFSLYQYCNNLAEKHPIFSTIRATHTMQTASWCTGQWGSNKSHIISWTWGNHRKTIQLQSSNQTYFTFILWYPDRQDWTWVAWRCRWQTQQDNKAHLTAGHWTSKRLSWVLAQNRQPGSIVKMDVIKYRMEIFILELRTNYALCDREPRDFPNMVTICGWLRDCVHFIAFSDADLVLCITERE